MEKGLFAKAKKSNIGTVNGTLSASAFSCFADRQERRPGLPVCHRPSRSRATFRKTGCSEKLAHWPVNTPVSSKSRTTTLGPFGEVIRQTGPMAKVNPFRFSTKLQDDESDLLYYGYRYYKPSTGTWPNRDPLGDWAFFRNVTRGLCEKQIKRIRAESLMPAFGFVGNDPVEKFDKDGRLVGPVYCAPCWINVRSALCTAQGDANNNVTDGSCHSGGTWCNGNCAPGTERDGSDADVLTHCIASCRLAQNPGSCMTPDDALRYLQSRETPGNIDYRNNNVGNGVGINIGPKGDCVQGCLNAMNSGLLYRQ